MTLGRLTRRLNALARQVEAAGPETIRTAALACDQALVTATPVDTGRARSNWIVTIGGPSDKKRDAQEPAALLAEAQAVLSGLKPGEEVSIANNLPYIRRLNEGYSPQADPQFVQEAVIAGLDAVRRRFRVFARKGRVSG